jgi:hypothetical protein
VEPGRRRIRDTAALAPAWVGRNCRDHLRGLFSGSYPVSGGNATPGFGAANAGRDSDADDGTDLGGSVGDGDTRRQQRRAERERDRLRGGQ